MTTTVPKIKIEWCWGHPAGLTDDLGIISDRDQWVDAVEAGWYARVPWQESESMDTWCRANLKSLWKWTDQGPVYCTLLLTCSKDVALFLLRWC